MFYPYLIKSIRGSDRVLEVGPGNTPYYRSDVLLELNLDQEELVRQSGGTKKRELKKPIVFYDGKKFPFDDYQFDYVIASHVLEHVHLDSVDVFLSELCRVAKRGYIEVPLYSYELSKNIEAHQLIINIDTNKRLFICDKTVAMASPEMDLASKLFASAGCDLLAKCPWYFVRGFEWESKLQCTKVGSLSDLLLMNGSDQLNMSAGDVKNRWVSLLNKNRILQMIYNRLKINSFLG